MRREIYTFLTTCLITHAMYVPKNNDVRTKSVVGIKIIDWQNNEAAENATDVINIFQNYTNVKVQQHENVDNLRQIYENNRVGNKKGSSNLHGDGSTTESRQNIYQNIQQNHKYQTNFGSDTLNKYDGPTNAYHYPGTHNNTCNTTNCGYNNVYSGTTISGTPYLRESHNMQVNVPFYKHQPINVPQNYYSGKPNDYPRQPRTYTECPAGSNAQYPLEFSCNQYLNCWNGRGVVQNCAPGTLFNPATFECDFPDKVNCISGPKNMNLVENLSEKEQANCPSGFSGIIPHYSNCAQFLNCDNGRQHVMDCPPGTLFDISKNICDHSYKSTCANIQIAPLKVVPSHVQQPSLKLQAYNYGNEKYFGVKNENSSDLSSQQTIHSSHRIGQNQIKPQLLKKDINQSTNCPALFSGLMANPIDCTKFLNCANGITYIMDCGPGTLFNPSTKVCDHPYNVKCNSQSNAGFNNYDTNHSGTVQEYSQHEVQHFDNNGNDQTTFEKQVGGKRHYQDHEKHGVQYTQQVTENIDVAIKNVWRPSPQKNYEIEQRTTETYEILSSSYKNKQWPPPFPSTDVNADYVFEYGDLDPEPEVKLERNYPKVPDNLLNWCERKGFECGHKICIDPTLVCNGKKDCVNGVDELECNTILDQFFKISGTKLAVREVKKLENITLGWCAKSCIISNGKSFNYRIQDGTCYILDSNVGISGALILLKMYDYYENRKYTIQCGNIGGYLCKNQKCIDKQQLCNGVNDCGDGNDEKGCTAVAFDYNIRLIGGSNQNSGRIEVRAFGKIGYVCDDMFGLKNADVVCREVGFPLGASEVRGNSYFAQDIKENQTVYIMDDVSCIGNETTLRDCDFNGWGIHNCQPQEIVGVVCKTPVEICPKEHWQCDNNLECLPLAFVCDGVYDCSDKSDEQVKLCDAKTEIRLSEGTKGRVELMHNGIWGTVCDDDFNDDAAKVICHQLGYGINAKVVKDGYFGPGSGPIWLDQVFCIGNESSLDNCVHWDWGEHNCDHSEDVGVVCTELLGEPKHSQLGSYETDTSHNVPYETLPEKCGLRSDAIFNNVEDNEDAHFRVVFASIARVGEYPWQASIRVKGRTKASHWCGAIVISSLYALTAAHCLTGFTKGAYFLVAGDYNVDRNEGTEQEAYIDDFVLHPKFGQGNKMNNDIALIRLKGRGFQITKDVQPICLPDEDFVYPVGLNCTISGFGSVESGKSKSSKELRAGWLPILSKEICEMPHVYGTSITPGMLCAGYMEHGVDACDGDSGGPLACLHEGVFKLFGITSWGQHCGYANKPGVYVNVAKYRKWIEETMKKW